jgi:hypothetical protein
VRLEGLGQLKKSTSLVLDPTTFRLVALFLIGIVWGGIQGPLGTAATNGLLCQPRVIMMMEKIVE